MPIPTCTLPQVPFVTAVMMKALLHYVVWVSENRKPLPLAYPGTIQAEGGRAPTSSQVVNQASVVPLLLHSSRPLAVAYFHCTASLAHFVLLLLLSSFTFFGQYDQSGMSIPGIIPPAVRLPPHSKVPLHHMSVIFVNSGHRVVLDIWEQT